MAKKKILVLNGPNLDMLGTRQPEVYGTDTLETLEEMVVAYGKQAGVKVECYQSNSEGKLIGRIHGAPSTYQGIVYNPGAHTHYSYALRDAVASIDVPVVEVHISDISSREPFRAISVIAPVCIAQVKGMGLEGYCRAIDILCEEGPFERLGEDYALLPATPAEEQDAQATEDQLAQSAEDKTAGAAADDAADAASESDAPSDDAAKKEDAPKQTTTGALDALSNWGEQGEFIPFDLPGGFDAGQASFNRQEAVRQECKQLGLGSLLVRDTSSIQWITAFDNVFDEERAHALLIAPHSAVLHTDSRYSGALRTQAEQVGSDIEINDERMSHPKFAHAVLQQLGGSQTENTRTSRKRARQASAAQQLPGGKLGMEDSITYAEFVDMVDCFGTQVLAPTTNVVLGLRAVKDEHEIARMQAAQAITDAAFAYITSFMRPGMTERRVQLELENFMKCHGSQGLAFPSIVAAGANGADPHAIPGETRLEAGQCVVLDFGARVLGYCADMTRTVFLGQPSNAMQSAWETLRRANEQVEALLKPGITGATAHQLAEQVLEEGGFGGRMGHGLGHGVGIDVHELPALNPRNNEPLVEGNVVTVEPGIYLPGEFGMRLEDFGVVTAQGFQVFTQSTHEMVVI